MKISLFNLLTCSKIVCCSFLLAMILGAGFSHAGSSDFNSDFNEEKAHNHSPNTQRFTLKQFVTKVCEQNDKIAYQKLDWIVSQENLKGEKSIFEPVLSLSVKKYKNHTRNTTEEARARLGDDEFEEKDVALGMGVELLLATGARLKTGFDFAKLNNSLQENGNEYTTYPNFSITQPLLRDCGIKVTRANIDLSQALSEVAKQEYRQELMYIVSQAIAAYWKLFQAQEILKIRSESLEKTKIMLAHLAEEVKFGKTAETELLDMEAGLAFHRTKEREARQKIVSAVNELRNFLFSTAREGTPSIVAIDTPGENVSTPDFEKSLKRSFELRPEYIAGLKKLAYENIRIAYAKNQRYPQVDLKASYGLNGFGSDTGEAWDESELADHISWSVGLDVSIPLYGGQKSKSELITARHRKKQALLDIKATEIALTNSIDTALRNIITARDMLVEYDKIVSIKSRMLDIESERFRSGQSNSKLVLDSGGRLNKALEDRIKSLIYYEDAQMALKFAEGSFLQDYEIKE